MKILLRALLVFALSSSLQATSISRSGGFVSVDVMIQDAVAIARIEVQGGRVLKSSHNPPVEYRVDLIEEIGGVSENYNCLKGPKGLRVGVQYLVFIQGNQPTNAVGCTSAGTIGDLIPRAMEIVSAPNGDAYVKLDSEKLLYPDFNGVVPVRQKIQNDNEELIIVLGTWVPLSSVLDYISTLRSTGQE